MNFDFRYQCGTDSVIGIFLYLSVEMGRRTKIRKRLRKISRTILQITIKNSEFKSLRIRYIFDLAWPWFDPILSKKAWVFRHSLWKQNCCETSRRNGDKWDESYGAEHDKLFHVFSSPDDTTAWNFWLGPVLEN